MIALACIRGCCLLAVAIGTVCCALIILSDDRLICILYVALIAYVGPAHGLHCMLQRSERQDRWWDSAWVVAWLALTATYSRIADLYLH